MELALRSSNLLIAIGAKLEGNTLHITHQSLILRVDSHTLVELAHMFYKVRLTIVNGEHGLMESPRKFCPFYLARER